MVEVKYNSFAFPPDGIKVGRNYSFGKDSKGYFIEDVNEKKHMSIEKIKELFIPINKTWEEVLKPSKATKHEE